MEQKDFDMYINTVYQHGCIMQSIALGHDLGLFKVICAATEPLSVKDIADKLDLKERYTKEWLAGMAAASILHLDRDTGLYSVPEGHRSALTSNTAFSPMIVYMGKRADTLKECFKKDGPWGSAFTENPEFFDWINGLRVLSSPNTINNQIVPKWEEHANGLLQKLETGIQVADVGCGAGNFSNVLAKRFPNSTFIGLDFSEKAVSMANASRDAAGLKNLTYVVGDATALPTQWAATMDMVFMYDVLHDLPNPQKVLNELHKVIKDDGYLSIVDPGFHSNPADNADNKVAAMFYTCSTFVCLPSSLSGEPHIGYGACWGYEEVMKTLEGQKFKVIKRTTLGPGGPYDTLYICTKQH